MQPMIDSMFGLALKPPNLNNPKLNFVACEFINQFCKK